MGAPEETFQRLVAQLDYPMFIATVAADGERAGCLVGFATQCSIHPARMLVCLSVRNHTFRVAQRADVLAVHFLSRRHLGLAKLFGEETGDEVDKFARCEWAPGPDGVPVLAGVKGWVAGRVLARLPAGDHTAFVLEPLAGEAGDDGEAGDVPDTTADAQLSFQQVRGFHPGHEP
jgi:flavin reductase (DIM6/NTAB) family NADH-FMN oxidoreductase RutF